jgi:tRNA dimethylallyltransferase
MKPGGAVIALLGPTGVGKTSVGVQLAERLGVRVISCDSMQLYRGFPVLTNQPTPQEQAAVTHELVGVVEPGGCFSASQYAAMAWPLIDEDLARRGWALVVGGTGLYLRAAVAPLEMAPAVDPEVRRRLERRVAQEGAAVLHAELSRLDPAAAAAIGPHNARRLVRALEVVLSGGGAWSGRGDLWEPAYRHATLTVGLTLERAELYRRIDARTPHIVEDGAEEVHRHLEVLPPTSCGREPPRAGIESAIGYREIRRYVEGEQGFDETVVQVAAATRRYARRQLTWLRKLRDAVIIDVHDRLPGEVADQILALALSGQHTKEPLQG